MPKVIGRDVSIFAVQLAGFDGNGQSGNTTSYLGKWETISISLKKDWVNVTSSDATRPTKRMKMLDFTGSAKGWIDQGGSIAIEAFLAADLIIMSFKDIVSGKTCTVRAGISKADATWDADHAKDTLDFEDVGSENFNGLSTLTYG